MSALSSRLSLSDRRDRDDSPEGRNPSRPSGQASKSSFVLRDSALCQTAAPCPPHGGLGGDSRRLPEITKLCSPERGVRGATDVTTSLKLTTSLNRRRRPLRAPAHDYFSSILAPTFSKAALIFSASALRIPFLTGFR